MIASQDLPFTSTGGGMIQVPSTRLFHGALRLGNHQYLLIQAQLLSEVYDPKNSPENFTDGQDLQYTKHMYFYLEDELSEANIALLLQQAKDVETSILFRGKYYLKERMIRDQPIAFISHDSRDKDDVARPLALQLNKLMCSVWYDEYSLQIGDSLRGSIEKGLKECKKCVLVLSPNFLSNKGWTKVEFNSIFTREIIQASNLVLPIWHNVTREQVYDYSPSLVDRLAADWAKGTEEVARQIYNAVFSPV